MLNIKKRLKRIQKQAKQESHMNYWQAIILGIIEGITEFLPISSTGHLILATHIMKIEHTNFVKTFQIFIQLGAILAVLTIYYQKLTKNKEIWKRIFIAFIPTGITGLLLYKLIKKYLIGNDMIVVISLILGGLILIFADKYSQKFSKLEDISKLDLKKSLMIGVFQTLAMIPGVSRSGATIIGGMLMGLNRKAAAEFSFLLAIPTMLIATSFDLYKSNFSFTLNEWFILILGFSTSFLCAILTVKALLNFLSKSSFLPFGIYRIILGIVYFVFFFNS